MNLPGIGIRGSGIGGIRNDNKITSAFLIEEPSHNSIAEENIREDIIITKHVILWVLINFHS